MQKILRTITFMLCLLPLLVYAGADHDHGHEHGHDHGHSHDPVTQSGAEQAAMQRVSILVDKSKIDSSWKAAKIAKAEKKKFGDRMEWVVSFKNDKISDSTKQTLYIFLSLNGEYIAANYSGK